MKITQIATIKSFIYISITKSYCLRERIINQNKFILLILQKMFYPFPVSVPPKRPSSYYKKYIKGVYEIVQDKPLGDGTYGQVKLVMDKNTKQQFALKIISKATIYKLKAEAHIDREIKIHSLLDHKNIVKMHEHFQDSENIYILMDYCKNGTLWDMIKKQQKLREDEAFPYVIQIANAIKYMHSKGVAHRDLKANNVLLQDSTVKICDFNWSYQLKANEKAPPCNCGTTEFMPPEVIARQPHDKSVDIWSFGILIYYMVTGKMVFQHKDKAQLEKQIITQSVILNETISPFLRELLSKMLIPQRITIEQFLESKWVDFMEKKLNNKSSLKLSNERLSVASTCPSANKSGFFKPTTQEQNHVLKPVLQVFNTALSVSPFRVQKKAFD
ncbi:hypothetical protein pb186bvf_016515 [Paramecium bursaria]